MEQSQQNENAPLSILVLYHEEEAELWQELRPHLEILEQCLPTTTWKCYSLPTRIENEWQQERFQEHVTQSNAWVLCTSAALVVEMLDIGKKFPFFQETLTGATVFALPLRAVAYVDVAGLTTPLAASAPGHARDQLCVRMALTLEKALRQNAELTWSPWVPVLIEMGNGSPGASQANAVEESA